MAKRARVWCDGTDEVRRAIAASCDDDSLFKLRYALGETVGDDPFAREEHVDATVAKVALCLGFRVAARECTSVHCVSVSSSLPLFSPQVIEWMATKSADEVNAHRIDVIESLEEAHAAMSRSGVRSAWISKSAPAVQRVARRANGALLEQLLRATGYGDVACVELLREGSVISFARVARVSLTSQVQKWSVCSRAVVSAPLSNLR